MGFAVVYAAVQELWDHVACTAVTGSSPLSRACCKCNDAISCPWKRNPSLWDEDNEGYCNMNDCSRGDEMCQQLAAGCGASLWDVQGFDANFAWGEDSKCADDAVLGGSCDMCKEPLWCDDPGPFGFAGSIKTPQDWVKAFFLKDGGFSRGHRQCKWKRSQKQQFIDTIRHRFAIRKAEGYETDEKKYDHWTQSYLWNEVTMYSGPGDNDLPQHLWDNLIALVHFRQSSPDTLRSMLLLGRQLQELGKAVPMFTLSSDAQDTLAVKLWLQDEIVDLQDRKSVV